MSLVEVDGFVFGDGGLQEEGVEISDAVEVAALELGELRQSHRGQGRKNMRNTMIDKGLLSEGIAPSYFIEGMLSNVPNGNFAGSFQAVWVNCYNWIIKADETKLVTASELHYLIRENAAECWPSANFHTFMNALKAFWES